MKTEGPIVFGKRCIVNRCAIGRFSGSGNDFRASDCEIGAFCSIGDNVILGAGTHPKNWLSTHLFKVNQKFWGWAVPSEPRANELHFTWRRPSTVGNDVWISSNVVVLSGLTIGDGVIIGANSVVTTDLPPYCVAVGSPAKIKSFRFSQKQINRIQSSCWWELPIDFLMNLPLDDIGASLALIESYPKDIRL
ncbi:CatB-related O-acetyltransferase [Deltaproteobacteria bacterium TL4]